jgi:hypothetical protein
MRVIAALHQPLTILAANNLADVVSPDDDNANGRTTMQRDAQRTRGKNAGFLLLCPTRERKAMPSQK